MRCAPAVESRFVGSPTKLSFKGRGISLNCTITGFSLALVSDDGIRADNSCWVVRFGLGVQFITEINIR